MELLLIKLNIIYLIIIGFIKESFLVGYSPKILFKQTL